MVSFLSASELGSLRYRKATILELAKSLPLASLLTSNSPRAKGRLFDTTSVQVALEPGQAQAHSLNRLLLELLVVCLT